MALNLIYTIIWGALLFLTAPIHVVVAALFLLVTLPFDPYRHSQHIYSHFIQRCIVATSPFMRVRVTGQENVDKTQTYVIMSNHQSMLDILFLYRVPLFFKWVSKHETYRIPFVGQLLWLHGDVTVKREDTQSIKRMMYKCTYWLQKKMCIMIFPEGTRSKTGQIGQFKRGAFVLAKRNALPILPVVLHGTRNFASGNRWNLLNARQLIQITILPPITAEEVCTTDAETMMEKTHNIMCAEHKKMLETEQTFSTRNG